MLATALKEAGGRAGKPSRPRPFGGEEVPREKTVHQLRTCAEAWEGVGDLSI